MTDDTQHHNRPTPGQLKLLRRLAQEREATFAVPSTFDSAHRQIERLLATPRPSRAERRRERDAISDDRASGAGDAAAIRDDELRGYGSAAGWA